MFWLRTLLFLSPLAIGLSALLLFRRIERVELPPAGDALVTSIQRPVGVLHPLGGGEGVTREIRDLIYEPLLRRDETFHLKPHILHSWTFRSIVTLHCENEESAGEIEAMIRSGEYAPAGDLELSGLARTDGILTLSFSGFAREIEERFLDRIDQRKLANFEIIDLTTDHSVEPFFEAFLATSIEKKQIRMVDFPDDRRATLFLHGNTGRLLEELDLYLESNAGLNPAIEPRQERSSHVVSHEALFRFRDDVTWHDGEAVSVDDILFSLEVFAAERASSPLRGLFWFTDTIHKAGAAEIRFLLRELPSPEFILECWEQLPILPRHRFAEEGSEADWERFLASPVGTGPYRFVRRFPGGGVELAAHGGYLPEPPAQQRLHYRRFDSLESKLLALRSFRIDSLVPDRRFLLWSRRNPNVVVRQPGMARFQHFVAWNLGHAPLSDPAFRKALALGSDGSQWVGETSSAFMKPVRGLFREGVPYDPGSIDLPGFDPVEADRVLEEAGFPFDAGRGIRTDGTGEPLGLKLCVNEANETHLRMAKSLTEQWRDLGIQVETEMLPLSTLLLDRLVTREFEAVLLSWEIAEGRDRFSSFHSSNADVGGSNFFGLDDEEVDRALEVLRFESAGDRLAKAAGILQDRVAELQPCLFLGESGRVFWFREGAISVEPPAEPAGEVAFGTGRGGREVVRSRPWWVKKEVRSVEGKGDAK